jgi:hypothetical protein
MIEKCSAVNSVTTGCIWRDRFVKSVPADVKPGVCRNRAKMVTVCLPTFTMWLERGEGILHVKSGVPRRATFGTGGYRCGDIGLRFRLVSYLEMRKNHGCAENIRPRLGYDQDFCDRV